MKKVLIFPLLESLPSGHHQVADTIQDYITKRTTRVECKKIDIMNRWNPFLERWITKFYISWIQNFPSLYAWVYQKFAYTSKRERSYKYYECLFLKTMKKILKEEKPDLIYCTHGFPSYLLNVLKESGECSVPVVNVYTDFFINDVWGRKNIEYHFVSNLEMKQSLISQEGMQDEQVFVTGIPISKSFTPITRKKSSNPWTLLLSGGSAGLGELQTAVQKLQDVKGVRVFILSGNNQRLYQEIKKLSFDHLIPLPYISTKEEMNQIYDSVDAIITKPGGVTVTEALRKRVPIFISSSLPGQEQINVELLKKQGLVFPLTKDKDMIDQVLHVLKNEPRIKEYERNIQKYSQQQEWVNPEMFALLVESFLFVSKNERKYLV